MAYITARNLLDFATNTGELYQSQCKLARATNWCGEAQKAHNWKGHVLFAVLPLWQRDVQAHDKIGSKQAALCASMLERYYAEHNAENDALKKEWLTRF